MITPKHTFIEFVLPESGYAGFMGLSHGQAAIVESNIGKQCLEQAKKYVRTYTCFCGEELRYTKTRQEGHVGFEVQCRKAD